MKREDLPLGHSRSDMKNRCRKRQQSATRMRQVTVEPVKQKINRYGFELDLEAAHPSPCPIIPAHHPGPCSPVKLRMY